MGAHPRSRGENLSAVGSGLMAMGSPAHAGKTGSHRRTGRWCRAHPRSRGENLHPLSPIRLTEGSSPLTRGKPHLSEVGGAFRRLIPAHAGKTRRRPHQSRPRTAHPRSRGENGPDAPLGILRAGSSPLTRGKQAPTMIGRGPPRLIPAHAGKTSAKIPTDDVGMGSSPLTRGKPAGRGRWGLLVGLIPAHAGKTKH